MSTPTRTMRALVYARQSKGNEVSTEDQLRVIRADLEQVAAEMGYDRIEVVGEYVDLVSASRYARKPRTEYPKVLAHVAAGEVGMVGVYKTDRDDRTFHRWTAFLNECREQGVLIRDADAGETYDVDKARDRQHLYHEGIQSSEEIEKMRDRSLGAARRVAREGVPNGPVPYGFRRDYEFKTEPDPKTGGQKQKRIIIQTEDPETAPIVREVFNRVAAGEPIKPLAEDLDRRGVPTAGQWRRSSSRYSHRWTPHGIRAMVRNKSYIGQRAHNGDPDTHKAIWPAIVDEELFWRAQRVLDDRARRYWRSSRTEHVLSGIPRCVRCGDGVFSGHQMQRLGQRYNCRKCGSSVNGPDLEELVLGFVLGKLAQPDVFSKLRTVGEDADAEVAAARSEVEKLRGRLAEWKRAAINGEVSPSSFAEIEDGLTKKITAAENRVERAGVPPAVRDLADKADAGEDVADAFGAMKLAAQRDVIADLVDVTITPAGRGTRVPITDRVTLMWRAASPTRSTAETV